MSLVATVLASYSPADAYYCEDLGTRTCSSSGRRRDESCSLACSNFRVLGGWLCVPGAAEPYIFTESFDCNDNNACTIDICDPYGAPNSTCSYKVRCVANAIFDTWVSIPPNDGGGCHIYTGLCIGSAQGCEARNIDCSDNNPATMDGCTYDVVGENWIYNGGCEHLCHTASGDVTCGGCTTCIESGAYDVCG
jgi:hypothetical protein